MDGWIEGLQYISLRLHSIESHMIMYEQFTQICTACHKCSSRQIIIVFTQMFFKDNYRNF